MTWGYDPTSTGLQDSTNQVRLLIGDTDTTDQLLVDEEIDYCISSEGDVRGGAAMAAELIAAEFSRKCDKTAGQLSISLSQKADHYFALAKRLRAFGASLALPHFGGISRADVTDVIEDTDRVPPAFFVGMLDNPPSVSGSSS